ncbi:MAG TPA: YeeE/YedE thiosulfate transporter family protein [Planctomycetota bacterium]|nr:YeeE/YedE thiosulfate transporter family protein [Planctomycetota bacterium]
MDPKPVLHWLPGGVLLGAVLLASVWVARPLGVSTQYVRAVGAIAEQASPGAAERNAYFAKEKITFGYGEMVVIGIPIGALLATLATRRRSREAIPEPWRESFGRSRALRFTAAFAGGILLLFGARLADGCTSGHVLSGVSQLAVSSLVFAAAAFGTAVLVARRLYPACEPTGGRP